LDPSIKNLREWIVLLFCLFCALDIAAVQYGMMLSHSAVLQPITKPAGSRRCLAARGAMSARFT